MEKENNEPVNQLQASSIEHRASSIEHPVSSIQNPESSIELIMQNKPNLNI